MKAYVPLGQAWNFDLLVTGFSSYVSFMGIVPKGPQWGKLCIWNQDLNLIYLDA